MEVPNKYIELLKNNDFESLSNISFIDELKEYKYQDKYLIEYLLEKGIHSDKMDDYLKFHEDFILFYLKYNITKPLLNCSLKVLLKKIDGKMYFDLILDKLSDIEKIELYYNIQKNSFTEFHENEREIMDIYLRQGIILPIMFMSTKLEYTNEVLFEDPIIDEFTNTFNDIDNKLLNFIVNEFKRCLLLNKERTKSDIEKIIKFKKENPKFTFLISNFEGSFDSKKLNLETNTNNSMIFNHEFSHFLYQMTEQDEVLEKYEIIRSLIDNQESLNLIKSYLNGIHKKYEELKSKLNYIYDNKIIEYYGSLNNYIEKLYLNIKDNTPDFILVRNKETNRIVAPFITKDNLKEVIEKFIETEKFEFINKEARRIFSPYLMLENLLDALLNGKLFDDIDFNCLSGHGSLYFYKEKNNSFDECLANFDAIRKSLKGEQIIKILKELVGDELIIFLDNYIKKNREENYGKR